MTNRHPLIIMLACLWLSACAQYTPYRIDIPDPASAESTPFKCKVDESQPSLVDKDKSGRPLALCEDEESVPHAIQHRYYQAWAKPLEPVTEATKVKERQRITGDYHLSFVEFDDQGWFADRRQMEALFTLLDKLEEENDGSTLIYVYAHGWKHNASSCDNNVVCFSRLLERTDLIQRVQATLVDSDKPKPRNVVGIYVGWRGLPFDGVLNNLSFWSRKDTAARVGRGGVFELLTRLKDYRDNRFKDFCVGELNQGSREKLFNRFPDCESYVAAATKVASTKADRLPPNREPTQLVITGHSFGGLVIYSALSHALMERAARISTNADGAQYERAQSFGDFVMLVNPAFEGSMYEPLFHIATHRGYDPKQKPVMMIVTSEADSATGIAFPMGRSLGTLLQHANSSEQKDSMHKAIGHNDRYLTHRLQSDGIKAKEVDDKSACPCKFLNPTSDRDVETMLLPLYATIIDNAIGGAYDELNPKPYGQDVVLAPTPEYVGRYPYLVVSTDAGVIADHNGIYNERFLDFTMAFIAEHISAQARPWTDVGRRALSCWPEDKNLPLTKGNLIPNQHSCQRADGSSCSKP